MMLLFKKTKDFVKLRWNTKEIFVKILDANDHSPEFSKEVFELYIMEDIPVGKEITQMRAVDLDQNNAYPFQLSEVRQCLGLFLKNTKLI